ncbi:hypothetical protein HNQ56_001775 [Anaerotaenia torta]|uniref:hypothetical protein n=1 Tax=Anaerotaenia torta TaxID=433293 RepID=UPI003D232F24
MGKRVGDYMSSVFKKLISRELGEANYLRYSAFVKKNLETKISDSQILYNDIYDKLKYRDFKVITKMHSRLNDTMIIAFKISKNFFLAFLFYLASCIFIIARIPQPILSIPALILINACFIYKSYEFISNKFCYIDAQIILVYKAVLDRIILNERKSAQENDRG